LAFLESYGCGTIDEEGFASLEPNLGEMSSS